eukprot:TRINITY_DN5896_c0_g1_i1.p1 TRINITY_DN5896_c0_g1~~TRINITY_DN5896_c0_g1_i1.p1  ORF type:complete len:221 (-),score=65.43 TRINITY_DN5896_c0_g1_i1:52-714(-)
MSVVEDGDGEALLGAGPTAQAPESKRRRVPRAVAAVIAAGVVVSVLVGVALVGYGGWALRRANDVGADMVACSMFTLEKQVRNYYHDDDTQSRAQWRVDINVTNDDGTVVRKANVTALYDSTYVWTDSETAAEDLTLFDVGIFHSGYVDPEQVASWRDTSYDDDYEDYAWFVFDYSDIEEKYHNWGVTYTVLGCIFIVGAPVLGVIIALLLAVMLGVMIL